MMTFFLGGGLESIPRYGLQNYIANATLWYCESAVVLKKVVDVRSVPSRMLYLSIFQNELVVDIFSFLLSGDSLYPL